MTNATRYPIEVEGKTVEDAIETALKQTGLARENAEINVLSEGTTGLFGLMGSKPAKISIQPHSSGKQSPAVAFSAPKELEEEIQKLIHENVSEIVHLMKLSDRPPQVKVTRMEAGFSVEINFNDPSDGSLLIGKGGRTLSALGTIIQSIVNRHFREKMSGSPLPKIGIDVNNYRIRQEEKIRDTVAQIIDTARKTGKPQRLNPMPARMRRIVHIALKENPEFESFSEGKGDMRRVVIRPRNSSVEAKSE